MIEEACRRLASWVKKALHTRGGGIQAVVWVYLISATMPSASGAGGLSLAPDLATAWCSKSTALPRRPDPSPPS